MLLILACSNYSQEQFRTWGDYFSSDVVGEHIILDITPNCIWNKFTLGIYSEGFNGFDSLVVYSGADTSDPYFNGNLIKGNLSRISMLNYKDSLITCITQSVLSPDDWTNSFKLREDVPIRFIFVLYCSDAISFFYKLKAYKE